MPVDRTFRKKIGEAMKNPHLRTALENFFLSYPQAREDAYRGIDFEALRERIGKIKRDSQENIESLGRTFERKIRERGGKLYRAADGREVAAIIRGIAEKNRARLAVKSKSMASEEVRLNERLEGILEVVETDLGEWIIQQIAEKPSHMVMPAIHLTREKCAEIFSKKLGFPVEPHIPGMVKLARKILRDAFLEADIGITGCNIAVAETGTMVILTNEGNGRLTATLPPVHIVLLGYEKLVRRFRDIAPLAAAIPRSATAQHLTGYVTMISGPADTLEEPGSNRVVRKELHVILLDNGRLQLLDDPVFKEIGQCIRCASCLNVCPVYRLVGGQVYGSIYSGGIGAVLTAFFDSPRDAEQIQELCLNCGRCREICPGKIDLPRLILELRSRLRKEIPPPFWQTLVFGKVLPSRRAFNLALKAASVGNRLGKLVPGLRRLAAGRSLPEMAEKPFREVFDALAQGKVVDPGGKRGTIAFFYGCLVDHVYPEIGESIVFLLNRIGYRVVLPGQGCCGAPAFYTGLAEAARRMALENLRHLSPNDCDYIVTACPTGTYMLREVWPRLLEDDPEALRRARQVAEKTVDFIGLFHKFREDISLPRRNRSFQGETKITYHYSCHLKRSSGIREEPRQVLGALPGIRWIEMPEADHCCGFAGTYSLKFPGISSELLTRKIENIRRSGAEIVAVDCPGCLLALRGGLESAAADIRACHSATLLAHRFRNHQLEF